MTIKNLFKKIVPNGKKFCRVCKEIKNIEDFYVRKYRGGTTVETICKSCNTVRVRETRYKREYGITKEQYYEMYEKQKGCCVICNKHFDVLCVDHDHKTGKVRSLLCRKCNYNLGVYEEKIDVFQNFVNYLYLHQEQVAEERLS